MKYLAQKLKQLRQKVVLLLFNRYFGKLVYSFETADEKIAKLSSIQREDYYREISEWVGSAAYKLEYETEVNELYHELAATTKDEDITTAYRLFILKLKNRDLRFKSKVLEAQKIQAFRTTTRNLK